MFFGGFVDEGLEEVFEAAVEEEISEAAALSQAVEDVEDLEVEQEVLFVQAEPQEIDDDIARLIVSDEAVSVRRFGRDRRRRTVTRGPGRVEFARPGQAATHVLVFSERRRVGSRRRRGRRGVVTVRVRLPLLALTQRIEDVLDALVRLAPRGFRAIVTGFFISGGVLAVQSVRVVRVRVRRSFFPRRFNVGTGGRVIVTF